MMTDCPYIDVCPITPSKEFYLYRCRGGHFGQCDLYRRERRLENLDEVGRLEDIGQEMQLEVFNR